MSRLHTHKPERPALTFVFFIFVAVFFSGKATFITKDVGLTCGVIVVLFSILCVFAVCKGKQSIVLPVCVVGFSGLCASALVFLTLQTYAQATEVLLETPVSSFTFQTTSQSTQSEYGFQTKANVSYEGKRIAKVWLSSNEGFKEQTELRCVGRFKAMDDSDYGQSNYEQGVLGTVQVSSVTHEEALQSPFAALGALRASLEENLPKTPGFALLEGILLGDKTQLKEMGIDEVFSSAGLAHMVAVSGAHLAIVSVFIELVCKKTKLSKGSRCVFLLSATFLYVLLCGAPISALRAWLMNGICFGASIVLRRNHALNAVSAVGTIAILAWPPVLSDLGFLLSVTCVLSICLFSKYAQYYIEQLIPVGWISKLSKRWQKRAYSLVEGAQNILAISLVCGIASAPLSAATFSQVSVIGPLSNLCITPLFAPLMAVGALALLGQFIPVIGPLLLGISGACGDFVLWLTTQFAHIPGAIVMADITQAQAVLILFCIGAGLLIVWPVLSRKQVWVGVGGVFSFLFLVLLIPVFITSSKAVILDVGQGDAILLQDKNHTFLVDTGPDETCAKRLSDLGVRSLDGVLITHQHDDHYGGLKFFSGILAVHDLYVAEGVQNHFCEAIAKDVDAMGLAVHTLSAGDSFSCGAWNVSVLWPKAEVDGSENKDSLCCLASLDLPPPKEQFSLLLTGDSERDEMKEYYKTLGSIDLLKVGHHGSAISISEEEAMALKPVVAVASAGVKNRYGHPKEACVEILEGAGSDFYCTKDVGSVTVYPDATGFRISTTKQGEVFEYD